MYEVTQTLHRREHQRARGKREEDRMRGDELDGREDTREVQHRRRGVAAAIERAAQPFAARRADEAERRDREQRPRRPRGLGQAGHGQAGDDAADPERRSA